MKAIINLLLGFFLLIISACQNKPEKDLKHVQKNSQKNIQIVKRHMPVNSIETLKDVLKKNQNFNKIVESFKPETYSIDQLIDLTEKDLKLFKQMKARRFKSKIDTAPVKSRLILTEINLKKLNFLIHKKKIETDTIEKTLNTLIQNLNDVIDKIHLYNDSYDEFEEILERDSLAQARKDSLSKIKLKNKLQINQKIIFDQMSNKHKGLSPTKFN